MAPSPPFGWPAAYVNQEGLSLRLTPPVIENSIVMLRLTLALDSRRTHTIRVDAAHSGEAVEMIVDQGGMLQPFEVAIPIHWMHGTDKIELKLSCDAETPPAILLTGDPVPAAMRPHLRISAPAGNEDTVEAMWHTLESFNSLQPFGWCEGCVLDALADRVEAGQSEPEFLRERLSYYFKSSGEIVYWDHLSRKRENAFYGIEAAHPFAALCRVWPEHPAIPRIADFLLNHRGPGEVIADRCKITSEGFLVVAYVLALAGYTGDREDWIEEAENQAKLRIKALLRDGSICQRIDAEGIRQGELWARGVGWFMLGLARLIPILKKAGRPTVCFEDAYTAAADIALRYQREDGLWNCFLDDPDSGAETSGSSGIATALALDPCGSGLPETLTRTAASLRAQLTTDGCLSGISQLNKGGEALQRGGYRVLAHFGTGLCGQFFQAWTESTADSPQP